MKEKQKIPPAPPAEKREPPADAAKEFLLQEYQALFQYHQAYKEIGDTRLTSFITLTGVVLTALIAAQQFVLPEVGPWLLVFGSLLLLALGLVTFRKMLQRRAAIVVARRRMARIRIWFLNYYPELAEGMAYGISETMPLDWGRYKIGTTASYVALVNCSLILLPLLWFVVQILSAQALLWAIPLSVMIGVIFWYIHILWKRSFFAESERMDERQRAELDSLSSKFPMVSTVQKEQK